MRPSCGKNLNSANGENRPAAGSARRRRCQRRSGAVFSVEMMMAITVIIPLLFALTEFSLLWSARHTLQAASYAGARAAAMPCPTDASRLECAKEAVESVLGNQRFLDEYEFEEFDAGTDTGDPVTVKLTLPMTAASPDMLAIIGISIEGRALTAETVTRRE